LESTALRYFLYAGLLTRGMHLIVQARYSSMDGHTDLKTVFYRLRFNPRAPAASFESLVVIMPFRDARHRWLDETSSSDDPIHLKSLDILLASRMDLLLGAFRSGWTLSPPLSSRRRSSRRVDDAWPWRCFGALSVYVLPSSRYRCPVWLLQFSQHYRSLSRSSFCQFVVNYPPCFVLGLFFSCHFYLFFRRFWGGEFCLACVGGVPCVSSARPSEKPPRSV